MYLKLSVKVSAFIDECLAEKLNYLLNDTLPIKSNFNGVYKMINLSQADVKTENWFSKRQVSVLRYGLGVILIYSIDVQQLLQ